MIEYLDHIELADIYKALFALIAGLILGYERELKDKSAGLKTITIICLGSALFTIISMKIGVGTNDPGRIAANIITGIGFLGAGVIFKSGFNVYGLTTAGIIWMSAAIGMAIGFGYVALGGIFLISSLLVIYISKYFVYWLMPQHNSRVLKISLPEDEAPARNEIIEKIGSFTIHHSEIYIEKYDGKVEVTVELQIHGNKIKLLEDFLLSEKKLSSFKF